VHTHAVLNFKKAAHFYFCVDKPLRGTSTAGQQNTLSNSKHCGYRYSNVRYRCYHDDACM